jgi:cyclophilin family peptidyl-prolyl cis-trans isomerase
MSIKKLARAVCALSLSVAACAVSFASGCAIKTNHPEAKITISFNDTTYELKYKLYRNMYPQTVLHFIELADSGFYNDTIIHNYTDSYWYGGGYSYTDEYATYFANSAMAEYLENNSKEAIYEDLFNQGALTPSVYRNYNDGNYEDALSTLIGEFTSNKHTIDNGALVSSYGCLRMYYTDKTTDAIVYTKKDGNEKKELFGEYKYNSATSLFNIQVGSSTSADSSYCIFGELKDTDPLEDLQEAISDYITNSSYTSSSFRPSTDIYVDNYDAIIGSRVNEVSYRTTAVPIIIKSIKITKY